jgi:hypothetical protein
LLKKLSFEPLEPRRVLSTVSFISRGDFASSSDGADVVFPADLDGDGDVDVLSASQADDKIAWYENVDGRGTFGPQRVITNLAGGARAVHAADLDGDGDMDVLSASGDILRQVGDSKIAWYENLDGGASFGPQQLIASDVAGARFVTAADVDGDGDLDALSLSYYDDSILWHENTDAADDFGPSRSVVENVNRGSSFQTVDFDGDGDIDVLAFADGNVVWLENIDGRGSFGPPQTIDDRAAGASALATADVDGDGDIDLLRGDDTITWYSNETIRSPQPQPATIRLAVGATLVETQVMAPYSVFAADVDGDGDMDVISANVDESKRLVWYANVDGAVEFGRPVVIARGARPRGSAQIDVHASDFDGDGDMDILWKSPSDGTAAWYENINSLGSFGPAREISASKATGVVPADVDGDGDFDVLVASERLIAWHENTDGAGSFGPEQVIADDGAVSLFAADMDGDGDMDIVTATLRQNVVYENDGSGRFGRARPFASTGGHDTSISGADFDSDGDLDVLQSLSTSERFRLTWRENTDGNGNLDVQHSIAAGPDGTRTFAASPVDFDGDGDVDVLAVSGRGVEWHENTNGMGNFVERQVLEGPRLSDAHSAFAADFDGDGDQDLVSAWPDEHKVAWYENTDGRATFGPQRVITRHAPGAVSLRTTDMDADGDFDVLATFGHDRKAAWYENIDGRGGFGPQQVITISGGDDIFGVDFDRDGDTDILTSISVWYENTGGAEGFVSRELVEFGVGDERLIHIADVDGDGDFDLLAASDLDDRVVWYENLTAGIAPRLAGDANEDGLFDRLDIQQVLESARYRTGEPAAWREGDWNRDGVFDQLDLIYALADGRYGQDRDAFSFLSIARSKT